MSMSTIETFTTSFTAPEQTTTNHRAPIISICFHFQPHFDRSAGSSRSVKEADLVASDKAHD
ncbi:hypothetical protein BJX65DRAFT_245646 [Aspergillus insuetus]